MTNSNKAFVLFCFNYPASFITDVWGKTNLGWHLEGKFDDYYNKHKSAAMLWFYTSLDSGNQQLLDDYIANWAKDNV